MGLDIKKTTGTQYHPVFEKNIEGIPGGVTIKTNRIPSDVQVIRAGQMLNADASTAGLYNVVKTATLYSNLASGGTSIKVDKNHLFIVGDDLNEQTLAFAGKAISSITRGTLYDTLVVAAIPNSLATDTVLREVTATATGSTYEPDCLLKTETTVRNTDFSTVNNVTGGAVVRGTVNESLCPGGFNAANKAALTALIRFA